MNAAVHPRPDIGKTVDPNHIQPTEKEKMKQKYTIQRNDADNALLLQEYGELDKEIMSLLCEETYAAETIKTALASGKKELIAALRTRNMYPPSVMADKIADAVMTLYQSEGAPTAEILFDDRELFEMESQEANAEEEDIENDDDDDDIDALIDEGIEDDYEDKKIIKDLKSSLKVADDDSVDTDDETA